MTQCELKDGIVLISKFKVYCLNAPSKSMCQLQECEVFFHLISVKTIVWMSCHQNQKQQYLDKTNFLLKSLHENVFPEWIIFHRPILFNSLTQQEPQATVSWHGKHLVAFLKACKACVNFFISVLLKLLYECLVIETKSNSILTRQTSCCNSYKQMVFSSVNIFYLPLSFRIHYYSRNHKQQFLKMANILLP